MGLIKWLKSNKDNKPKTSWTMCNKKMPSDTSIQVIAQVKGTRKLVICEGAYLHAMKSSYICWQIAPTPMEQ